MEIFHIFRKRKKKERLVNQSILTASKSADSSFSRFRLFLLLASTSLFSAFHSKICVFSAHVKRADNKIGLFSLQPLPPPPLQFLKGDGWRESSSLSPLLSPVLLIVEENVVSWQATVSSVFLRATRRDIRSSDCGFYVRKKRC